MFNPKEWDWSIRGNIGYIFLEIKARRLARNHTNKLRASLPKETSVKHKERRECLLALYKSALGLAYVERFGSPEYMKYTNMANDIALQIRTLI